MSRLFQKFKQDIVGILFLTIGLFIGLSLASFNPIDPSLNSIGKNLIATNFCGYVGSFLSDALFQVFGLMAWVLVFGFLRISYLSFKGESISFKNLRMIWASILILTASALISIYLPKTRIYQDQILVGGLLGVGLSHVLIKAFNMVGAQIVAWAAALTLLVFYSEKTVQELIKIPMSWFYWTKDKIKEVSRVKMIEKKSKKEKLSAPITEKEFKPIQLIESHKDPAENDKFQEEQQVSFFDKVEKESAEPKRRKVVLKTKIPQRIENWELPKLSLLEDPPASRVRIDEKEIKRKGEILREKLAHFEVTGEVVAARPGPAVTMFEFRPDANVKVSEVTALEDDLALALSSESLRILAPVPGRDVVGIETSNANREVVYFKDMLAEEEFWKEDIKLPIALGKTATGESKIVDLRRMPHLMVAGTTGSGKSVFTVSMITGLLFRHSPKTLKMIIVDPKMVDYSSFENIPHLALPIINDTRQAVVALKWAVQEMEKRYRSMSQFGARGLEAYNETVSKLTKEQIEEHEAANLEFENTPGKKGEKYYHSPLPYLVIILEEFSDLISVDKQNVEHSVVRLAQKARACGMHLVLATQSPRKEAVTGLIKTNIPGRISFKVASATESRIILDETGAERLLAQGDMLFKSPGNSSLIRHHGPFLKESEITGIAKFWSSQAQPEYDVSAMRAIEGPGDSSEEGLDSSEGGESEYDDRYDEILSWASTQKSVSTSLIQRRFSIGYPRAARLLETFEREGVVGPANGSKPRQVLINNLNELTE